MGVIHEENMGELGEVVDLVAVLEEVVVVHLGEDLIVVEGRKDQVKVLEEIGEEVLDVVEGKKLSYLLSSCSDLIS
jgi:hypothetical protein